MSLPLMARVVAVAAFAAATTGYAVAELKGDYNVEFVVEETTYTGTAKVAPGAKGAFTGKFEFTAPSVVLADVTGKTQGDSVTYEAKYEDKGRGCAGTFTGRGTTEKDGSKAAGTVAIDDSCSGPITATFRLWR
jgi:hypothetical protein